MIGAIASANSDPYSSVPPAFFTTSTRLIDRAHCETDESTLQLIPYITLRNPVCNEVFCYYRGEAGGEARLHGALSIGLGGHVDMAPTAYGSLALRLLLDFEGKRELLEEASVDYSQDLVFTDLLCNPTDAVGRVHIGLFAVVDVTSKQIRDMKTEVGVVERGEWMSTDMLRSPDVYSRLEPWSKVALSVLRD